MDRLQTFPELTVYLQHQFEKCQRLMAIARDASHGQCTGRRWGGRIKKVIVASQGGILPKDVSECYEGVPSVSLAWLVERGSGDGVLTVCSA